MRRCWHGNVVRFMPLSRHPMCRARRRIILAAGDDLTYDTIIPLRARKSSVILSCSHVGVYKRCLKLYSQCIQSIKYFRFTSNHICPQGSHAVPTLQPCRPNQVQSKQQTQMQATIKTRLWMYLWQSETMSPAALSLLVGPRHYMSHFRSMRAGTDTIRWPNGPRRKRRSLSAG